MVIGWGYRPFPSYDTISPIGPRPSAPLGATPFLYTTFYFLVPRMHHSKFGRNLVIRLGQVGFCRLNSLILGPFRPRPSSPRGHTNSVLTKYDCHAPIMFQTKYSYNLCNSLGGVGFQMLKYPNLPLLGPTPQPPEGPHPSLIQRLIPWSQGCTTANLVEI